MAMLDRRHGFPRVPLWSQATLLEPQPRLAQAVGAREILIKRDDCNGLAFGGNKVRQLEYYIGDAVAKGADTVLMTGAIQSNFVRTAAAACNRYGLKCHIQLEDRVPTDDADYKKSGNVLLDELLGATLHYFDESGDEAAADDQLSEISEDLRAKGAKPYVVPMHPSHDPIGALGYVDCANELVEQLEALPTMPDRIFVGSGSGNTHAGLIYGLRRYGCPIPVTGICVRREAALQSPRIQQRCAQLAGMFNETSPLTPTDIKVDGSFLAPYYGKAGPDAVEAIKLCAQMEGLLLDPVYTAKVMAGLIAESRKTPGTILACSSTVAAALGYLHTQMTAKRCFANAKIGFSLKCILSARRKSGDMNAIFCRICCCRLDGTVRLFAGYPLMVFAKLVLDLIAGSGLNRFI